MAACGPVLPFVAVGERVDNEPVHFGGQNIRKTPSLSGHAVTSWER